VTLNVQQRWLEVSQCLFDFLQKKHKAYV